MANTQQQKALAFQALHQREQLLVLPNPWDAGSAKILAALGFEALATTSAGLAFSLGRADGEGLISREDTLSNARAIVEATPLPVAADLENGFADEPQGCADTLLQAAACGLVGGSIEDASGKPEVPIYPLELAVERIRASVAAVRSLPFSFTLCARAENFLHGREDLADTLRRLEAYADAGADVLYAPGLTTRAQIDAVVRAVAPRPVNVLLGLSSSALTFDDLATLGVRRVSVGSSLARVAFGGFLQAARGLRQGDTGFARNAAPFAELNELFKAGQ
ncbi:isocitrate lyase/phosphoenolpyruvate mutase family protein [Pseudomonas berkeleyensis]|uniref:Isocitrate lyase/phosphoenolpyruvate mutase family protein n=1 Tax=Pseudomonas berkeleyensis TaxID=2726956 RepID=A0A7G5DTB8_9PSED|nr:isocitrate lyase/phosphoenolpyruvate mutase family protein [Pseudomonas berkeleyensis]QMV64993.1 isocitrate lyase/phosphoenolpyruvate mutase family protein [Pseudomonas berkeleyensis]WSO40462.1 isocitrate lyase/phosphoenolpyruvate mutase family protein [Pseudomonas berkeleyensis]